MAEEREERGRKAKARLKDIEVERVDGVDRPATGLPFILIKSEEEDEMAVNLEGLRRAIERALDLLAKAEDLPLTEEQAEALDEVLALLGRDGVFKAKRRKKPADEDEEDEEGYGYPYPAPEGEEEEKPKRRRKAEGEAVAKALSGLDARLRAQEERMAEVVEVMKSLIDHLAARPAARSAPPSRQPRAQDEIAKADDPWRAVLMRALEQ